ncbi:ABC transporter permease [Persicitalea jodogahamensis]|uniref:ABC transporter permease n=1 Tax=Persicitalea jodogahamensis TaxID=402147 RepID=A0A8J3D1U0_9BACT|nr:ABC transporter permease [Persicitalea jodogahamensis]GHB54881.1 ABC transporter permease [Persicitalea jodogahamensis]
MIKNYFKIAWRNLTRNRLFSLVNIAGLSLGLTCCMLIVLYIKDEVSFDRFQEHKDELYRIQVTFSDENGARTTGSTNAIHGPAFKQEIPEIKEVVRTQSNSFVIKKDNELFNQSAVFADDGFFRIFTMPLLAGNPETVLSDIHSIVLTERIAEKYFNTTDAVGRTLDLKIGDEFETFTVSGVAQNCPENSSIQFETVLPFKFQEAKGWTDTGWMGFYMNTFVLLHDKADSRTVVPKLDRVFASKAAEEIGEMKDSKSKIHFDLQPFLTIHMDNELSDLRNGLGHGSSPIYSYLLSGIALFILLIACINFVNLTVARSLNRAKEIGIRKVAGSKRTQLVAQFLSESILLAFVAFAFALALTQVILPTFNELANKQLALSYLFDFKLVAMYIGLLLVTGFVAGFYPALALSGFSPTQTLYNRLRLTRKNYLTKGLVVFQFALSVSLVVATLVIFSQFEYLTNKDLGYNDENLMVLSLGRGGPGKQTFDVIKQELQNTAGIKSVAGFNGHYNGTGAKIGDQNIGFSYIGVDDDFLNTLEIPLEQGRNFSQSFTSDPTQSVIINEAFVREAGWKDAIGKEIYFEWKDATLRVVGIVRDYHYASLKEKIEPLLLTQDPNYRLGTLMIKLDTRDIPATVKAIEQVFHKHIPLMPFEYVFEDMTNFKKYEKEAKWKQIITLATILSIFVSCIGLFGLATFNAESRLKEVGIRKVLGASVVRIATLLSTDFIKLVLFSILIAVPISYYAISAWLQDFPYRIELSWDYYFLAAILSVAVALITVGFESIKAALMNPVKSLRSE